MLLAYLLSTSHANAQILAPSDPTQPTPLGQLNSDLNGNGFNFNAPTAPQAAARPGNWPGGKRPKSNAPGDPLIDAEGFTAEEAQRYARELEEQARRAARLGGPPAVPVPLYGPQLQAILASPYELANSGSGATSVVTDARPLAAAPRLSEPFDDQFSEAEQVVYQAPVTPAGPPMQAPYYPPPSVPNGGVPAAAMTSPAALAAAPPAAPGKLEFNDPSMVIARVDQEVILLGDVLIAVNEELAKNAGKIPPDQMAEVKRMFIEMAVRPVVEAKLVTADLKRKVPEEGVKRVTEKLNDHWEKEEYRKQLRTAKVESRRELEAEYRRVGTTLEREKKRWLETELARQWMGQQIKFDEEVTHEQMLKRYHADIAKYEITAGVRWEELKASYTPATRPEAWRKLAEAGNQILSGVPFAEVAKRVSEGTTAASGGGRDWTTKGSLASQTIDESLFALPVGQLSGIIDDGQALYIVRVVERREAGVVPFTEAQADIKKQIQHERIREQSEGYMKKLYAQARVWTIFDAEKTASGQATAERTAARVGNY